MQYCQDAKKIRSEVPPCCQKHCTWKLFLPVDLRSCWKLLQGGVAAADAGMSLPFPRICLEPGGAAPKAIPPAQQLLGGCSAPLSLPVRREHMAAYLCPAVLMCLVGLWSAGAQGDLHGERTRRDLERVGCMHGKWSGARGLCAASQE